MNVSRETQGVDSALCVYAGTPRCVSRNHRISVELLGEWSRRAHSQAVHLAFVASPLRLVSCRPWVSTDDHALSVPAQAESLCFDLIGVPIGPRSTDSNGSCGEEQGPRASLLADGRIGNPR